MYLVPRRSLLPRLVCLGCLASPAAVSAFTTTASRTTTTTHSILKSRPLHYEQLVQGFRRRGLVTRLHSYLAVHVFGQVKEGAEQAFQDQTLLNARNSIMEKGIARFDVCQGDSNPREFCLLEVYRNPEAPAAHKETKHYAAWRDAVAPLMAGDRQAKKYRTVYPPPQAWATDESAFCESLSSLSSSLLVVLVDVEVKEGCEESFKQASIENARASMTEGGIHRFDVLVSEESPRNFILLEVYNHDDAPAAHKLSAHYLKWRDTVEEMMARPRTAQKFRARYPGRVQWHRAEGVTHAPTQLDLSRGQSFSFEAPEQIIFGEGAGSQVPALIKKHGAHRPLVVTGKNGKNRFCVLLSKLPAYEHSVVHDEPTIEDVRVGLKVAKEGACDCVVAIGGGSAIDAGKAIAAMLTNEGDVMEYVEVIGKGKAITNRAAPFIAVPTTSGTGSEVTKNAVVKSREHGVKVSMRSPLMMPTVALLDPLLTITVPPHVTAHTGLDALCQNIEPYCSNKANPLVDAVAREGIVRASRSLRAAYRNGGDLHAREDMALASVMGGLALANSKLGAVHGFAGVIGGVVEGAAHGAVCAALLPWVFRANVKALTAQVLATASPPPSLGGTRILTHEPTCRQSLRRHEEVARLVTGKPLATAEEGAAWLEALVKDLDVPGLSAYGITDKDIDKIVPLAAESSSMKGNPVTFTHEELKQIMRDAL